MPPVLSLKMLDLKIIKKRLWSNTLIPSTWSLITESFFFPPPSWLWMSLIKCTVIVCCLCWVIFPSCPVCVYDLVPISALSIICSQENVMWPTWLQLLGLVMAGNKNLSWLFWTCFVLQICFSSIVVKESKHFLTKQSQRICENILFILVINYLYRHFLSSFAVYH